jgi:DNA-binding NarL/FixJ family response regulator
MRQSTQCPLTPALLQLLEACITLKTTETKPLAMHLNRAPATVRTEFQRILTALDVHCRYAALKIAEDQGWLLHERGNNAG